MLDQKIYGPTKDFCPKTFLAQNDFGSEKKIFVQKQLCDQKHFRSKKKFVSKKILGKKKIWIKKKILVQRKILVKNFFEPDKMLGQKNCGFSVLIYIVLGQGH